MAGYFDPDYFDPAYFDVAAVSPPESPGTSVLVLTVDGTEVGAVEWNASGEEVLGGTDQFVVTVQDRLNSGWEPTAHQDVKITIRGTGWVLARGEIMLPNFKLPLGEHFIRWTLNCRSYTPLVREALFGAPSGGLFVQGGPGEPYRPVDPSAQLEPSNDGDQVADLIGIYRPVVGGEAIDVATYVFNHTGSAAQEVLLWDDMTTFGDALDRLSAMQAVNVQDWLDPDLRWHHQEIPSAAQLLSDGLADDLDAAPVEIGPSGGGHRIDMAGGWDGQAMPEQLFEQAVTTFTHDGVNADAAGATGWYPVDPDFPNVAQAQDPSKRQAYISSDAWSREQGISFADAALRRGATPTLRMSFGIEGVDGWRAGQLVTINDALLPPSLQGTHKFVIQRIAWNLEPGLDRRRYQIDVGDGPVSRANTGGFGQQPVVAKKPVKKPVINYRIYWVDADGHPDNNPIGAGETRNVIIDTANALGESHQPAGVSIDLSVVAVQADPSSPDFGDVIPAQGTFDPNPAITDQDGKARSTFTAGDVDGLSYAPLASTPLPQAA